MLNLYGLKNYTEIHWQNKETRKRIDFAKM